MRATGRRMGVPTVRRYELLAPPGFDGEQELKKVLTWLGWAAVCMLIWFFLAYMSEIGMVQIALEDGYEYNMRQYADVARASYLPFLAVLGLLIQMLIRNIVYFRSGSKSYYTMRRLRDRSEYPKRCALLPVCGLVAGVLAMWLLTLVCGGAYLIFTPDGWLPAGAGAGILKLLSGGLL